MILRILWFFILLFGFYAVFRFGAFLRRKTKLNKTFCWWITLLLCISLHYVNMLSSPYFDPSYVSRDKLACKTESYEEQVKIYVTDVAREKGKEAIYTVTCSYGTYKVPEGVYEAYIGEGSNRLTFRIEEATLYVSNSVLINHNFDSSNTHSIFRYSPPWESDPQTFTEEEISEFVDLLLEEQSSLSKSDFTFDIDKYEADFMDENCLEDGAERIKN